MTPAPPATATTSSSYKFPSADTPLATKVVVDLVVKETHSAHSAHYMPNYIDMCKRRLDGCGISVGDCILWNVGGRPVKAVIKDVEGSASQYFRVNRNTTEIQAKMVQQETENTLIMKMSEEAEGLVSMIDYSFQHSEEFQLLGIPAVKSILLHGVAGVGKTTVVRYASQFLRCSLFDISVHELLELSEEFENTQFVSYNPLRLVMKQAIISAPSIVVLRDLNDLVNANIQLNY
ncbi:hypothetical protein BDF14DRAFT_1183982 [Spinellus fusiger]|nr:hypothetical protein BDF14DRAFT_1183982 [Spinellus fusiger]